LLSDRKGEWKAAVREEVTDTNLAFETYAARHIEIQTCKNEKLLRPSTKLHFYTLLRNRVAHFSGMAIRYIDKPMVDEWFASVSRTAC
jgi:hypothetical protein